MPELMLLSWNLQGQNPYTSVELRQAITHNNPDIVFVCEAGENTTTNFTANLWVEDHILLSKVNEHRHLLSQDEKESADRTLSLLNFEQRPNAFVPLLMPVENPPNLVAAPNASTYTTHLDRIYPWDSVMIKAEGLINQEVTGLRNSLQQQGVVVDRATNIMQNSNRLHPLHQAYPQSEIFEMTMQFNRNYLVLWKSDFHFDSQRAFSLSAKRPMVIFSGPAHIMFMHAIAAEGAAKKQLREAAALLRETNQQHGHPAVLTGDLNCTADVLTVDQSINQEIQQGLRILSTGQATQYSGGELDYALGFGINDQSQIALLPTHSSDHRAVLLKIVW